MRERGEVQEWLQFFLGAVQRQAEDAITRATGLVDERERLLADARSTRSSLPGLVDIILVNPFVTVVRVQRALGLTSQGARNVLRQAEARGWLEDVSAFAPGNRSYWVSQRVLDIIDAPLASSQSPASTSSASTMV